MSSKGGGKLRMTLSVADKANQQTETIKQLRKENERLQRIIDSRPAINAALPQSYIEWSQGIYQCDINKHTGVVPQ
jgi:hypothetical protein